MNEQEAASYVGRVLVLGGLIPGPYICMAYTTPGSFKLVSTAGGLMSAQVTHVNNIQINSSYEDDNQIGMVIDSITRVMTNPEIRFSEQGHFEAMEARQGLIDILKTKSWAMSQERREAEDAKLAADREAADLERAEFFRELSKDPSKPAITAETEHTCSQTPNDKVVITVLAKDAQTVQETLDILRKLFDSEEQ